MDPRLALLDPGAPGKIVICASGGAASFSVTASPAIGTLLGGGSFSVADGACATAWTANENDLTVSTITVTQTSGGFGYIEATAAPPTGLPYMSLDQSTQTVAWKTNSDHGGSATFFQNVTPPPPATPKKVVLCKEGPAGTYSFTVSASGGTGADIFPSGTSVTIAAGECKDVWTTNLVPPPDLGTTVTITEDGTAALDSIVQALDYAPPSVITGTRTVASVVNFYHGAVVTYFNTPLVSATCTSITATKGIAITPVQMSASGGAGGPYSFTASGLPSGLSLSSSGLLTGTPTVSGQFTYTIIATDNQGNTGSTSCAVTVNEIPPPPPTGSQGCTPGYWKAKQHWDSWAATGYTTTQLISSVFDVPATYTSKKGAPLASSTLVEGLGFQGGTTLSGKAEILLRAAIAGLLNSSNGNVDYFYTTSVLISSVNAALNSGDGAAMVSLAAKIDTQNNKGCPLN
jgi:hypothetical protein